MKNRAIVGLLAGTLALVLAARVAWAATVQCQENDPADPVEVCLGTPNADTITGTSEVDYIRALAGSDLARGMGGADAVQGGKGKDTVKGLGGSDQFIFGGESGPEFEDGPFTDASDDYAYGGDGADSMYGGYGLGGVDRVFGEDGNDYIQTNQRGYRASLDVILTKEIVNCGAGQDTVQFDEDVDEVAPNCEDQIPIAPGEGGAIMTSQTEGLEGSPIE